MVRSEGHDRCVHFGIRGGSLSRIEEQTFTRRQAPHAQACHHGGAGGLQKLMSASGECGRGSRTVFVSRRRLVQLSTADEHCSVSQSVHRPGLRESISAQVCCRSGAYFEVFNHLGDQ